MMVFVILVSLRAVMLLSKLLMRLIRHLVRLFVVVSQFTVKRVGNAFVLTIIPVSVAFFVLVKLVLMIT